MQNNKTNIDKHSIEELANILEKTGLSEIEYEANGIKIRVAKNLNVSYAHINSIQEKASIADTSVASSVTSNNSIDPNKIIKSPIVGTLYVSPEPGAQPYVKEGDHISEGQIIFIIEAMKIMNQIKATKSGTVKKILIKDTDPVEFDTPLLVLA